MFKMEYDNKGLSTLWMLPVFLHQAQVTVKIRGSDYVFNTYRAFFNLIWGAVTEGRFVSRLEKARVNVNEWEKGPDKWNGRRAFVLVNRRRGIVFYCRSLQRDMPVMFSFMDVGFSTGDMAPLGEKNTVTISKMWDANEPTVLISVNFVGHPSRYREFLERIADLAHRPVDWGREFESGRAIVKPVRAELYVRYDESRELEVRDAIRGLYRRYGVWVQIRENRHEGVDPDSVVYNGRSEVAIDGLRLHIKTYRRQRYKHPAETPDDHPKVEVSVYFGDGASWDDVEWQLNKAGSLLASFVSAIHLEESLITGWDTYPTAQFEPDPLIVRGIIRGELEEVVRRSVFPSFRLGELDKELLLRLSYANLDSQRIKRVAEELGVPLRTLRYHMRKLERLGLVIKRRIRRNQWIYMMNVDALRDSHKPKVERDILAIVEEAKRNVVVPAEIVNDERLETVYLLVCEGYTTSKALAKVLGVSERRARWYLTELRRKGLIDYERVGRYVRWRPLPVPLASSVGVSVGGEVMKRR